MVGKLRGRPRGNAPGRVAVITRSSRGTNTGITMQVNSDLCNIAAVDDGIGCDQEVLI